MASIVGIDGCRMGWLCLIKDLQSGEVRVEIISKIDELLSFDPKPCVVAIDVPIGLPDKGRRDCDCAARQVLKAPRASSVFSAPIRPMLVATSYEDACEIGVRIDNRKLSRQAWSILPKIAEVDSFIRLDQTVRNWIYEVHPEVSFFEWNKGKAMAFRKKSDDGRKEREVLVKAAYGAAYESVQEANKRQDVKGFKNDDILDAFAALWTAERITTDKFRLLPENRQLDSCQLPMNIVA